jgi:hypothetical protein
VVALGLCVVVLTGAPVGCAYTLRAVDAEDRRGAPSAPFCIDRLVET